MPPHCATHWPRADLVWAGCAPTVASLCVFVNLWDAPTCMLVPPFVDSDSDDDCLGLGGELVGWLRKLSQAKDTTAMIQASESPFFPAAHVRPL